MKTSNKMCLRWIFASLLLCLGLIVGTRSLWIASAETGSSDYFQKEATYTSTTFSDVRPDDWFYENVKTVYEYGLMVGNSATTFNPSGKVSIAETITIAARLHSLFYTGNKYFETSDPWYQTYVNYAMSNGIISGEYQNYDRAATRAEYAVILSAAFPDYALEKINQIPDNSIPDVLTSATYGKAVYKLYRAGILIGNDEQGTFAPDSNIQRSEVAAIISRMAEEDRRIHKNINILPGNEPSSENSLPADAGVPAEIEPAIYGPSFVLGTRNAKAGAKDIPVTVALKNNPGIASVGLTVSYDAALTLKKIVYNDQVEGDHMLPPAMNNPVKLIWVSPFADVTGDWVLATLYFDIGEDAAPGYHQIAAVFDEDDIFNVAMDNVSFAVINGSINVTE